MDDFPTDHLYEFLRAKRSCLTQLRDLSHRQMELIDGGDMTRLLDLLVVKQRMIEQLQRIERALDPFRGDPPEARRWRSAEVKQRCADEAEQCELLLAEVMNREKQGEALLTRRRDEVAHRLQGAHRAAQARQSYLEPPQDGACQLDVSAG